MLLKRIYENFKDLNQEMSFVTNKSDRKINKTLTTKMAKVFVISVNPITITSIRICIKKTAVTITKNVKLNIDHPTHTKSGILDLVFLPSGKNQT